MALGRWQTWNLGGLFALATLVGCGSSGGSTGGGGTGGETDSPGDPGEPANDESSGTPGATTGGDETSAGGSGSSESSGGSSAQCDGDDDCDEGSACIGTRCCYAVAYDGSCCESGYCGDPNDCEVFGCEFDEVCTDHRCEEVEPLGECEDPFVPAISLPIPGLADATVVLFAESDGSAGQELVALADSTVTLADAVPTGIPVLTTLDVPGKSALVGAVAEDLDGDGLEELLVVDAEGTVTLLHALGASTYEAVQAIGAGVEPPLVVADLDGDGLGVIGRSAQGYATFSINGLALDPVGHAPPEGISGASFIAVGALFSATDLAVRDAGGVAVVSSPDAQVQRVDPEGGQPAIQDVDGDGLTELAIVTAGTEATIVKLWSLEALSVEGGEAERDVLPVEAGAQAWGNIDGDEAAALLVASPTRVAVVRLGPGACYQWLGPVSATDLLAAGDLDGDGHDEVVIRGASGLVLLDASTD